VRGNVAATKVMKNLQDESSTKSWRAISRRKMIQSFGLAGGALLLNSAACSQKTGTQAPCSQLVGKRVRWLVPFPPGGGYDIYSRLLEPFFQQQSGAEIVIENLPGAGGIISANKLKESATDGLTLGILNAPGLLVAALTGAKNAPNPASDFSILGRIVRNQTVFVTANNSPFRTMADVFDESKKRPIVFGISEVGSTNFVNIAVVANLLGINAEFIAGFAGSRETSLAAIRGEVDLSAFTFESVLDRLIAQDLRALLQISPKRISPHELLNDVALFCGEAGIARRRATELARDPLQTEEDAIALTKLLGAGLLVAAPSGLNEKLFHCLEQNLNDALTDREFQAAAAKANRSLDVGKAEEALAEIRSTGAQAERFIPMIQEAIKKIRE
jgi:tripartite-type tricarboxylate transporter receptor subunit TctC